MTLPQEKQRTGMICGHFSKEWQPKRSNGGACHEELVKNLL